MLDTTNREQPWHAGRGRCANRQASARRSPARCDPAATLPRLHLPPYLSISLISRQRSGCRALLYILRKRAARSSAGHSLQISALLPAGWLTRLFVSSAYAMPWLKSLSLEREQQVCANAAAGAASSSQKCPHRPGEHCRRSEQCCARSPVPFLVASPRLVAGVSDASSSADPNPTKQSFGKGQRNRAGRGLEGPVAIQDREGVRGEVSSQEHSHGAGAPSPVLEIPLHRARCRGDAVPSSHWLLIFSPLPPGMLCKGTPLSLRSASILV